MKKSRKKFNEEFIDGVLSMLWRHWIALGVSGGGEPEDSLMIDPEALLLLSMTAARFDARLFDEIIDWLEINGRFINIARLKNIARKFEFQGLPQFTAVANILSGNSSLQMKWRTLKSTKTVRRNEPFFIFPNGKRLPLTGKADPDFQKAGFLRSPVKTRGYSKLFPNVARACGMLRCRAIFGINVRSDIFCLLSTIPEIHPARAAKLLAYQSKTVQEELNMIELSGLLSVREDGRKKLFSLDEKFAAAALPDNGNKVAWLNAPAIFRALESALLFFQDETETEEMRGRIKLNRLRNELLSIIKKGEPDFIPRFAATDEYNEVLAKLLSACGTNQSS
jgi:hypothetical protein